MNQPPHPALPMAPPPPRKSNVALILIIVGVVGFVLIAGVGVLAALGIYGTRKYLIEAKKAEGKNVVGAIARGMVTCMEAEDLSPTATPRQLPPSSPPVPASLPRGVKYQSSSADWASPAFSCARFSMSTPQYFQYQWERVSPMIGIVRARADLDGDGKIDAAIEQEVRCTSGPQCSVGALLLK